MSTRNFRDLIDRDVLPRKTVQEGYSLDEVRSKYITYIRSLAAGQGDASSGGALTAERAALAREQREAVQFKNAVARGEYVPRSEVKRQIVPRLEITRERILSLPGKLGDLLTHRAREEVEEILEQEFIEALNDLAAPLEFDGGPDRTQ
jgi:phage terminase Nu1 subunit (DNA packaging protein)